MYTIDIDTGGTMTDGLVSDGTNVSAIKVETTPHDHTVSFRHVLTEAARMLGYGEDVKAFLDQVSVIRWSNTITTNTLAERTGAKVGVLVRKGHERTLYGDELSPMVGTLVAEHDIIGLSEDPDEQEILAAVRRLLEDGTRRICVCLDAFPDNRQELAIKRTIADRFPDHYLGAVPVVLGSEMAPVDHHATRTHAAVINAYVHSKLASSLYRCEDLLRDEDGWRGSLLIGHINGGVARVGKTKALDTIESGPVFGTHGAAWYARRYGMEDVVCLDVGGTTTKASIVEGGRPKYVRDGNLFGAPLRLPLVLLRSAVLGGGSVARPTDDTIPVTLGPDSMGAAPGPACYGLGGDQATLTDALLVLGFLDAERFLGGRRTLDTEKARAAIDRRVAQPLGVSVEDAARAIADRAVHMVADVVGSTMALGGMDPADASLFAYGGNGGLLAAYAAERLGIGEVRVFSLGPVFSAFGSAVSDVVHVYERSLGPDASNGDAVDRVVAELEATGRRDLAAEGFDPDQAETAVEFETDDEGRPELVRVRVRQPLGSFEPPRRQAPSTVPPAQREMLPLSGESVSAPVYDWDGLSPGERIEGPAVAAGGSMTCLVPPGWTLEIDEYGDGVLRATPGGDR